MNRTPSFADPAFPSVVSRRSLLAAAVGGLAAVSGSRLTRTAAAEVQRVIRKGRIRQSVCRWCYGKIPLEELAAAAAAMGFQSIELLSPQDFPVLREARL